MYFSSRELRQILTTPGPNQMSTQQAQSVVDEMLEKYDANNDKRFSYIGNWVCCVEKLWYSLVASVQQLKFPSPYNAPIHVF